MNLRQQVARKFIDWLKSQPEGTVFGFPNPLTGLMYAIGAKDILSEVFGIDGVTKDPNLTGLWEDERAYLQEFLYEVSCGTKSESNHANKLSRLTKFDGSNVSRYGLAWEELKTMRFDPDYDSPVMRHKSKTKAGSVKITKVTFVRV